MEIKINYYIKAYSSDSRCNPQCKDYSNIEFNSLEEVKNFLIKNNIKLNVLDEHWDKYELVVKYNYQEIVNYLNSY